MENSQEGTGIDLEKVILKSIMVRNIEIISTLLDIEIDTLEIKIESKERIIRLKSDKIATITHKDYDFMTNGG